MFKNSELTANNLFYRLISLISFFIHKKICKEKNNFYTVILNL